MKNSIQKRLKEKNKEKMKKNQNQKNWTKKKASLEFFILNQAILRVWMDNRQNM